MSLCVGNRIGSYEVIALIGEGGMGEVSRDDRGVTGREVTYSDSSKEVQPGLPKTYRARVALAHTNKSLPRTCWGLSKPDVFDNIRVPFSDYRSQAYFPLMSIASAARPDLTSVRVVDIRPTRGPFLREPTTAWIGRGECFDATGYLSAPSMPSMDRFPSWQAYS